MRRDLLTPILDSLLDHVLSRANEDWDHCPEPLEGTAALSQQMLKKLE